MYGEVHGAGQYKYDGDFQTMAVHTGHIVPGDIKTVIVWWMAIQNWFVSSLALGVATLSAPGISPLTL